MKYVQHGEPRHSHKQTQRAKHSFFHTSLYKSETTALLELSRREKIKNKNFNHYTSKNAANNKIASASAKTKRTHISKSLLGEISSCLNLPSQNRNLRTPASLRGRKALTRRTDAPRCGYGGGAQIPREKLREIPQRNGRKRNPANPKKIGRRSRTTGCIQFPVTPCR